MNSIIATQLGDDLNGYKELYMDNRYNAPDLFAILLKYKLLACATIRTSRKVLNTAIMLLKNKREQGECLTKYDQVNETLFGQWRDLKVVSFVSPLPLVGEETANCQCGMEIKTFKCPSAFCVYNCFMGCVDFVDYNKKIGGGLTARPHFKKWYKKVIWEYLISCW